MRRNGMGQKFLLFFLTAAMILSMYNLTALAEPEPPEMPEELETSEEPEVPEPPAVSENTLTVSENSVTDIVPAKKMRTVSRLEDSVLEEHVVCGQNPEEAVVNLFDFWQVDGEDEEPKKEYIWDWTEEDGTEVEICDMGISRGHLLRFGQTETIPEAIAKWNYGAWNMYSEGKLYQGIVQNTLDDGFPRLNFGAKQPDDKTFFGNYVDNHGAWLDEDHRTESLSYLFSVAEQNSYKEIYENVQGLFQMDKGYYYYDSRENFAEFDKANPRFILYDSPGVGMTSGSMGYFGQFFPFNSASQVFDTVYDITDEEHPYLLSYTGKEEPDDETEKTGEEADNETRETEEEQNYIVRDGNASFLSCTYPELNHYIGMTLEVPFLQTVGGRLADGSDMTFKFSGDDDVWIFIDDVLVADLGGIHDAYELSINFADGTVSIPSLGEERNHTLRDSFEAVNPSADGFSGNTFADNTEHTLKMFYLERGHMASNLSLRFNLQNARYNQIKKVDQNGNPMSGVEFALYSAKECDSTDAESILCTSTVSGTSCNVKQDGTVPLLTLETGATAGYRSGPVDIVLEYDPKTEMLSVANKWQTGAYVEKQEGDFLSCICIPNEQRELRVKKVNEDGELLNGARFGLYESREAAERKQAPVAVGTTASVTGGDGTAEKGVLIFKPQPEGGSGYAKMAWPDVVNKTYYLREISGPSGYAVNPTVIPIVIGAYSAYADAGTEDDGVSVEAGVGRLSQSMVKYAAQDEGDITLRDITAIAQGQNVDALRGEKYEEAVNNAKWNNLGEDADLTGLFSLLNVVVVEDQKSNVPGGRDPGGSDPDGGNPGDDPENPSTETDNPEKAPGVHTAAKADLNAYPAESEQVKNAVVSPQTGDDSLIGWWAALSLISLLGIGATVYNMVLRRGREKKRQ